MYNLSFFVDLIYFEGNLTFFFLSPAVPSLPCRLWPGFDGQTALSSDFHLFSVLIVSVPTHPPFFSLAAIDIAVKINSAGAAISRSRPVCSTTESRRLCMISQKRGFSAEPPGVLS